MIAVKVLNDTVIIIHLLSMNVNVVSQDMMNIEDYFILFCTRCMLTWVEISTVHT